FDIQTDPSQAQDAVKMTPSRSEHITSGSGEKQTHTAALRTSLQQEDRLLRAEEQGIIDQGSRTAIHIREQEVQRDIRELR
ncbi:hypothetical protein, partial [Klebsiella pneumoniae]